MQTSLSPSGCCAFLGYQIEKAVDELNLPKKIISSHPSNLPLPDHDALGTIVPALLEQNKDWKAGDIAMLYRSLNESKPIAAAADALGLPYFRVDNGSSIERSRLTEWLTDCAKWCSGGWESGAVNLGDVLKGWRPLRRSLTREPTHRFKKRI